MPDECAHARTIRKVTPSALGCEECLKLGSAWVHLRLCRTCGHVGCCAGKLTLKVPRLNYFEEGLSLATDGRPLAFGRTRAATAPRAGQTAPEIYAHS